METITKEEDVSVLETQGNGSEGLASASVLNEDAASFTKASSEEREEDAGFDGEHGQAEEEDDGGEDDANGHDLDAATSMSASTGMEVLNESRSPVSSSSKKTSARPKSQPFEGEPVQMDLSKILTLDHTGTPLMALQILKYMTEQGLSREALLRVSGVGQYSTAVRWWLKGEKLGRPTVVNGAAIIIEWYEALKEGRPRRNMVVDIDAVKKLISETAVLARAKAPKPAAGGDPALGLLDPSGRQRKRARPGALSDAPPSATTTTTGRRSAVRANIISGGEGDHTYQVRFVPATGRWDASVHVVPGEPDPRRLGIYDTQDDAVSCAKAVSDALTQYTVEKASVLEDQGFEDRCSGCDDANNLALRRCSFCPKSYHETCVTTDSGAGLVGTRWICPATVAELLQTAKAALAGAGAAGAKAARSIHFTTTPDQEHGSKSSGSNSHKDSATAGEKSAAANAASGGHPAGEREPAELSPEAELERLVAFPSRASTETEWIGPPHITAPGIHDRRAYYSGFYFKTTGDAYHVLDHVLLSRRVPDDPDLDEPLPENQPEFYVGQIEALWEDASTEEHARMMRIAWLFWPQETSVAGELDAKDTRQLLTSNEADVEPIVRVLAKLTVLTKQEFDAHVSGLGIPDAPANPTDARLHASASFEPPTRSYPPTMVMRAKTLAMSVSPMYAHYHFNQRTSTLLRPGADEEMPAWSATFVRATKEAPDQAGIAPTLAINPIKSMSEGLCGELSHRRGGSAASSNPKCGFCARTIWGHEPAIQCTVCLHKGAGLILCVECLRAGRQGMPSLGSDPESAPRFIHRISHPYRVLPCELDPVQPGSRAIEALEAAVAQITGEREPLTFNFVEIARVNKAGMPRQRLRCSVQLPFDLFNDSCLLAQEWGSTLDEAKSQAAVTALTALFGSRHALSGPLMQRDWSVWEVARLMDACVAHALAWEPISQIVGTKTATQCRRFYSDVFFPAWLVATNADGASAEESLKTSEELGFPRQDPVEEELGAMMKSLSKQCVEIAIADAVSWAGKVRAWRERRTENAGRVRGGLGFVMLGDQVAKLPLSVRRKRTGKACRECGSIDPSKPTIFCDACGDEYHLECLTDPQMIETAQQSIAATASAVPVDWFCHSCLQDEKYLYEYEAWGNAGRLLAQIADRYGELEPAIIPTGANAGKVRTIENDWLQSKQLIESAVQDAKNAALRVGIDVESFDAEAEEKRKEMLEARRRPPPPPQPEAEGASELQQVKRVRREPARIEGLDDEDVYLGKPALRLGRDDAWAARHYLEPLVAALLVANKGLSDALLEMTRERDALLLTGRGAGSRAPDS